MSFNLATILTESALSHPDKTAVISGTHRLTYAELDAVSDRFAIGLRAQGIRPGDTVGLQLPNIPQFVIAYFGLLKAGAVAVPMNVLYKADEIAYILRDAQARMLITWASVAEEAAKSADQADVPGLVIVTTPGSPDTALGTPFELLLAEAPEGTLEIHQTDPGDTAVIVYTSGTTGRPKGAELTHFQLFMNADTPGRLFGIEEDDVIVVVLPLFHIFALSSILDVCVRFAATMTLVPRFDPDTVLATIERDRVTVFEGVPTMYIALLNHPDLDRYDVSSLRVGISGGRRSRPRSSTTSRPASGSSSWRATACPRRPPPPPSTSAPTTGGCTASDGQSGVSRCRSGTSTAMSCRPVRRTSAS